ncbi:MAG: hypothetical protein EHM49_00505 [Deltaproteobacteria bacterium]|nr:MAG: hypothetical protein EHM49_00505 [Deltaproteobacteria bacterium]
MRIRNKDWWHTLTEEERKELHHLERANATWVNRFDKGVVCRGCGKFRKSLEGGVCKDCRKRIADLIDKADRSVENK